MDKGMYATIESFMLECMKDSAHDKEHVYRVLNNALSIAQTEPQTDYTVLITACLLHDIGRTDQLKDPTVCHAAVGSEKAYVFLLEKGWNAETAARVRDCIRTHRFRKNDPPQTLEAKILFDADKLDVVGAIGIARTLAYQGAVSAPMYSRLPDGSVSSGAGDAVPSFFREYKFKLEKLYDRFYTQKGAELAANRRDAARRFYEDLLREVRDSEGPIQDKLTGILI